MLKAKIVRGRGCPPYLPNRAPLAEVTSSSPAGAILVKIGILLATSGTVIGLQRGWIKRVFNPFIKFRQENVSYDSYAILKKIGDIVLQM